MKFSNGISYAALFLRKLELSKFQTHLAKETDLLDIDRLPLSNRSFKWRLSSQAASRASKKTQEFNESDTLLKALAFSVMAETNTQHQTTFLEFATVLRNEYTQHQKSFAAECTQDTLYYALSNGITLKTLVELCSDDSVSLAEQQRLSNLLADAFQQFETSWNTSVTLGMFLHTLPKSVNEFEVISEFVPSLKIVTKHVLDSNYEVLLNLLERAASRKFMLDAPEMYKVLSVAVEAVHHEMPTTSEAITQEATKCRATMQKLQSLSEAPDEVSKALTTIVNIYSRSLNIDEFLATNTTSEAFRQLLAKYSLKYGVPEQIFSLQEFADRYQTTSAALDVVNRFLDKALGRQREEVVTSFSKASAAVQALHDKDYVAFTSLVQDISLVQPFPLLLDTDTSTKLTTLLQMLLDEPSFEPFRYIPDEQMFEATRTFSDLVQVSTKCLSMLTHITDVSEVQLKDVTSASALVKLTTSADEVEEIVSFLNKLYAAFPSTHLQLFQSLDDATEIFGPCGSSEFKEYLNTALFVPIETSLKIELLSNACALLPDSMRKSLSSSTSSLLTSSDYHFKRELLHDTSLERGSEAYMRILELDMTENILPTLEALIVDGNTFLLEGYATLLIESYREKHNSDNQFPAAPYLERYLNVLHEADIAAEAVFSLHYSSAYSVACIPEVLIAYTFRQDPSHGCELLAPFCTDTDVDIFQLYGKPTRFALTMLRTLDSEEAFDMYYNMLAEKSNVLQHTFNDNSSVYSLMLSTSRIHLSPEFYAHCEEDFKMSPAYAGIETDSQRHSDYTAITCLNAAFKSALRIHNAEMMTYLANHKHVTLTTNDFVYAFNHFTTHALLEPHVVAAEAASTNIEKCRISFNTLVELINVADQRFSAKEQYEMCFETLLKSCAGAYQRTSNQLSHSSYEPAADIEMSREILQQLLRLREPFLKMFNASAETSAEFQERFTRAQYDSIPTMLSLVYPEIFFANAVTSESFYTELFDLFSCSSNTLDSISHFLDSAKSTTVHEQIYASSSNADIDRASKLILASTVFDAYTPEMCASLPESFKQQLSVRLESLADRLNESKHLYLEFIEEEKNASPKTKRQQRENIDEKSDQLLSFWLTRDIDELDTKLEDVNAIILMMKIGATKLQSLDVLHKASEGSSSTSMLRL